MFTILQWKSAGVVALMLLVTSTVYAQRPELPIGAAMPQAEVAMQNYDGRMVSLQNARGSAGTAVVFWSNTCPWVTNYEERILEMASAYQARGINFVLVNSNDPVAFPGESFAENQGRARASQYSVPYVLDEGSKLASAFGASRTPHVFLFDANGLLFYAGTVDDSPADARRVQQHFLRDAVVALVEGRRPPVPTTRAFGCTIKFQ